MEPLFDWVGYFQENGLARAVIGDKYGYIDTEGRWIVEPLLDDFETLLLDEWSFNENGLVRAKVDGKWGVVNIESKWVIEPQFNNVWLFDENGFAKVQLSSGYGIINTEGNFVVEPLFGDVASFNENGLVYAELDGKYGFLNTEGQCAVAPQYNFITHLFICGLSVVYVDAGKLALINENNERLTSVLFSLGTSPGKESCRQLQQLHFMERCERRGWHLSRSEKFRIRCYEKSCKHHRLSMSLNGESQSAASGNLCRWLLIECIVPHLNQR